MGGGFSVSGTMNPFVAFSVGRSTELETAGLVQYDQVLVNTDHFDIVTATFTAPKDGVYYFSMNVGVRYRRPARVHFMKNGAKWSGLFYNSTTRFLSETLSTATLMNLSEGDKVTVHLDEGYLYSSELYKETYFTGFRVSPNSLFANPNPHVEWLVYKTDVSDVRFFYGLKYNKVSIMVGATLTQTNSDSAIVVPYTGVYYIHISVGCKPRNPMWATLHVNGDKHPFIRLSHWSSSFDGFGQETVSAVVGLNAGDELEVRLLNGLQIYGTDMMETSLMGFLISEV